MKVNVIEEDKELIKIELVGETETLTHLIARETWEKNGEGAAVREHPFMVEPKILVKGKNPRKILEKSAKSIQGQCDEFKEEFRRSLK